jgi:hypothetical protein
VSGTGRFAFCGTSNERSDMKTFAFAKFVALLAVLSIIAALVGGLPWGP